MEKKGNITLRTMNSRRKKVQYNVNVHLKNRVVKKNNRIGEQRNKKKRTAILFVHWHDRSEINQHSMTSRIGSW